MKKYVYGLGVLASIGLAAQTLSSADKQGIVRYRATLAESMQGPQSPLNMVALQKLQAGDTTVGSATGSTIQLPHVPAHLLMLRLQGEQLQIVEPAVGFPQKLLAGGKPATEAPVSFDADGTSPVFQIGSVNFVLRHKFGFYLVARDMQAPSLLAFRGLRWYAPDARYRVQAQWKPWPQPHKLRIANILGQVNEETSYGMAELTLDGHTYRLEPSVIPGRQKPLFFVFRDGTSRTTTYGSGRFLDAAEPSNGFSRPGTVLLDFNQARNPWCAFSVHTSCPLPPVQNRLPISIPAGEQRYPSLTAE